MATSVNSNATYNGLKGYLTIATSFQYKGISTAGSTIALGAYFAWAINNAPVAAQYPGISAPGSGLSTKLLCAPLRWGLRRGMMPIAGSGL